MRPKLVHFLALASILLLSGLVAHNLRAHGIGKPQLLNEAAGPYLLSAWTDPDPLRADEAHVVVAVIEPETRELIVGDVDVIVTMYSLSDPAVVHTVIAGTDNVNQLLYAAEFNDLVTEGQWRVGIRARGERDESEEVAFEVEIDPPRGFNWLWIGAGGMAAILILWMANSMRGEKSHSKPRRRGATR